MKKTVFDVLQAAALEHGEVPALREKRAGEWVTTTWAQYRDQVVETARGFLALGLEPGRGVAILGANRPRWFLADLGAIAAGGIPVGIYTTSTPDQSTYVAGHAGAQIAILENPSYVAQLDRSRLPDLGAVVLMEGEAAEPGILTWDELRSRAAETDVAAVERRIAAQAPDDGCTLIYTSGTTGRPKGVLLSHHNIVWTAGQVAGAFDITPGEVVLSYLPLSHVAEQVVSLHAPMAVAATTWFAESLETLGENLREARPHFFFGVPRVWEKIQARMQAAGAAAPAWKRRLASWAKGVGLAAGYAEQRGERRPWSYPLADRLVFSKVRERLGFDRARVCSTSAAPIALDTLEYFLSLGIPILEVYGMSECTGPATFSLPDRYATGKAGFAIPDTELRLAGDGEILMRGPHVFLGYYKDPEATAETVDGEGWLHSGDVGSLDEAGFLAVTDRKKEILITSGGKNVAPQPIEARLKGIQGVGQAVVVGDGQRYLAALLVLDPDTLEATAKAAGSPARTLEEASACPRIRAFLETGVEAVNRDLARYESIKSFAVLAEQLTVETGELTPTMKLKRRAIRERRAAEIAGLYGEGA
jgi:long-subunit acyl-CoA synthetase (AMP-forming)